MGLRSNDPSTDIHKRRRVMAFVALATMAITVVITLAGLALHPYVILVSSAAIALIVAGVVLIITTRGATRVLGIAIGVSGIVAWVWMLVDDGIRAAGAPSAALPATRTGGADAA
jgi:hypothetical protein